MTNYRAHHRSGAMLVFCLMASLAVVAVAVLAIDWSRAKLLDNQLKAALDSAALAGAGSLRHGPEAAINAAIQAAGKNQVDGSPVVITAANVQLGVWDPAAEQFTPLSGNQRRSATAVRIVAERAGIPTFLGRALGKNTVTIREEAIATRGLVKNHNIDGRASPWLAGMPNGSKVTRYGGNPYHSYAPECSPYRLNIPLVLGAAIHFSGVGGFTRYADSDYVSAEGDVTWIVAQQPDNGINTTYGPINSLGGIFLDDRRPDTWALQPTLDFSTAAKRNFTELRPKLKQVFFIGDGLNSDGELQRFIVPAGATRLYIGIIDEKGWWWDQVEGDELEFITIEGNTQLVR